MAINSSKKMLVPISRVGIVLSCLAIVLFQREGYTQNIEVKKEVEVSGESIKLGDILVGDELGSNKEIPLLPAPKPGYARVVPNTLITSKLKQVGVNPETLNIHPSGQTVVKRATACIPKDLLVESLRHYIQEHMPWDIEQTKIEIYPPTDDLILPDGDVEITWEPNNAYAYVGIGVFRGVVRVDGKLQKTIICRAKVEVVGCVVVAVCDIPRGKTITEKDVSLSSKTLSHKSGTPIWDLSSVIGMSARRSIPKGSPIRLEDLETPIVVKRNQIIPLELTQGGITITAKVKVLSDARVGDRVRCIYLDSEQPFEGIVQSDGTIKVE